jgi:hypothetical protein
MFQLKAMRIDHHATDVLRGWEAGNCGACCGVAMISDVTKRFGIAVVLFG